MKSALIVARDNGYGLSNSTGLVAETLTGLGWNVDAGTPRGRPITDRFLRRKRADVVLHLERVFPQWASAGHVNCLIPNQERFPERHLPRLSHVDAVLVKTRHAEDVFSARFPKVRHVGFRSRDRHLDGIEKNYRKILHLAGGSTLKGTEKVLEAWARNPGWPELVLIQKADNAPKSVPANVTLHDGYMSDDQLRAIQNECGIHLCPSASEGWGHYIHEAMSCGAVVVTTDGPPMNEFVTTETGFLIPADHTEPRHLGINYHVSTDGIEAAMKTVLRTGDDQLQAMGERGRPAFLQLEAAFAAQLSAALDELVG